MKNTNTPRLRLWWKTLLSWWEAMSTKAVLLSWSGCVSAQDSQGLHRSRFGKELRSRKGDRNGFASFLCFSHVRSLLQKCWSHINWCCFNWSYDSWKLKGDAAISCLLPVSMLHMEFPPLHNSHPPITTALINLIENHQQGMLEMIFKLIEKGFQLSYWKIYTYLC